MSNKISALSLHHAETEFCQKHLHEHNPQKIIINMHKTDQFHNLVPKEKICARKTQNTLCTVQSTRQKKRGNLFFSSKLKGHISQYHKLMSHVTPLLFLVCYVTDEQMYVCHQYQHSTLENLPLESQHCNEANVQIFSKSEKKYADLVSD